MHEAWDIILTLESFWDRLDNFKSHVMRGTCKKIKDEFMCLGYLQPVLYQRFKSDLSDYLKMRRLLKHVNMVGQTILRPPKPHWHAPGKMLMVQWTNFLMREDPWDWDAWMRTYKRYFTGCYW